MSELVLPGRVVVRPPDTPRIEKGAPNPDRVLVVPVSGPRGLPGLDGAAANITTILALADQQIALHVADPEPHPAYDDIPSLVLLFENRLV